jgi:TIR domain
MTEKPDAFLSYTRSDDSYDAGGISKLRDRLAEAVRAVTGEPFEIFQDIDGIGLGEHWPARLDELLNEVRFFIPILTPSYFKSKNCRDELTKFINAEKGVGRSDLILPIYYIQCPTLEEEQIRQTDDLATTIYERQRYDWRDLRLRAPRHKKLPIEVLAQAIDRARRRGAGVSWRPRQPATTTPAEARLAVNAVSGINRGARESLVPATSVRTPGHHLDDVPGRRAGDLAAGDLAPAHELALGQDPGPTVEQLNHIRAGVDLRRSPGQRITEIRRRGGTGQAILFLHGFSAGHEDTWGLFPLLVGAEPELNDWDILSLGYGTSMLPDIRSIWSADPDLPILATHFRTRLNMAPLAPYRSLAIVAHSMGGLVVQRALLDDLDLIPRVRHVIFFGTPSGGLVKAGFFAFLEASNEKYGRGR